MAKTKTDQTAETPPQGLAKTMQIVSKKDYSRTQPPVFYSFDCEICGKHHEIWRLPGKQPKYCPPEHGQDMSQCQKKGNAQRVKEWRQAKRGAK